MRFAGINWLAVLVAAAVFFAIGYVIHMQLVDLQAWDAAKHTDQAQLSATRMAAGMILPLATAIVARLLVQVGQCQWHCRRYQVGACRRVRVGASGALVQLVLRHAADLDVLGR
jgi:hypothetical protein